MTSGTSPLRMWRSVPQIVAVSMRTIASVGSTMHRIRNGLPGPLTGAVIDESVHGASFGLPHASLGAGPAESGSAPSGCPWFLRTQTSCGDRQRARAARARRASSSTPHSLSYQATTFACVPPVTVVSVGVEDRGVRRLDHVARDERLVAESRGCPRARRRSRAREDRVDLVGRSSRVSSSTVRSTSEPVSTGTRAAKPCSLPASSGMTSPIAFAAPVDVGTMFDRARARAAQILVRQVDETLVARVRRGSSSSSRAGCRTRRAAPSRPARGSSSCTTRSR